MSPIPAAKIDQFVREEGERVWHQVGSRCWCYGPDGQLDGSCQVHDSTGSVYGERNLIVGLVTDIMQKKELAGSGFFLPGDAIFSPLSGYTVSEGDKIIYTWPIPYGQGDPLVRGYDASDKTFYEATNSLFCMDEERTVYTEGIDFRFAGKTIVWRWADKPATGREPRPGMRYTVKYRGYVEWIAFFPPMERMSHGADIGQKVMLRKLHVIAAGGGG